MSGDHNEFFKVQIGQYALMMHERFMLVVETI